MLTVYENEKTVILAGRVSTIKAGTSKSGSEYVSVTIDGEYYDESMDMNMKESKNILFLDQEEGLYGPLLAATNFSKLKVKEGSLIIVKATKSVAQDGTVSYFGKKCKYVSSGGTFLLKPDGQPQVTVVYGRGCPKNDGGKDIVSIPTTGWDRVQKEETSAWFNCTAESGDVFDESTVRALRPNDSGKKPFIAVVAENIGTLTDIKFTKCVRIG